MGLAVAQVIDTRQQHYKTLEQKPDKHLIDFEKFSHNTENLYQNIAIWKNYLEKLKAGSAPENPSPSGDKWFLIPENIEIIIEGLESGLEGKFRVVNPKNIWEGIES